MPPTLHHRRLWTSARLDAEEARRFLEAVRALRRRRPGDKPVLQGRHVALLCGGPGAASEAFGRAVTAAGGSFALLHDESWQPRGSAVVGDAARLLGSLYDAVDCCDLSGDACAEIERQARIPVFDGLARPGHPLRLFAAALALREWADERADRDPPRVRIPGDAASDRHRAARIALQSAGLSVEPAGHAADAPCDFILEPGSGCQAARVSAPLASAVEQQSLAAMARENEQAVVQAAIAAALS